MLGFLITSKLILLSLTVMTGAEVDGFWPQPHSRKSWRSLTGCWGERDSRGLRFFSGLGVLAETTCFFYQARVKDLDFLECEELQKVRVLCCLAQESVILPFP